MIFKSDDANTFPGIAFTYSTYIPYLTLSGALIQSYAFFAGDSFTIPIPYNSFVDPSSNTNIPSLSYIVTLASGSELPYFASFNINSLSIIGTFPLNFTSSFSLNITAINSCGYSNFILIPVAVGQRSIPDNSSTFSCESYSVTISSSTIPTIKCSITTKLNGSIILSTSSAFTPYLASGEGALGSLVSENLISSSFYFLFYPFSSGGVVAISSGIANMTLLSINVYCSPDITSSIYCDKYTAYPNDILSCSIIPKIRKSTCFTQSPFTIG